MSELRNSVNELFKHKVTISHFLLDWNDLLNFYTDNKNKLDDDEILLLYKKSEEYREFANEDREEFVELKRASGEVRKIRTVKRGLGCRREEVATDLYFVADQIKIRQKQEEQRRKEQRKLPTIIPQVARQVPAYVSQ